MRVSDNSFPPAASDPARIPPYSPPAPPAPPVPPAPPQAAYPPPPQGYAPQQQGYAPPQPGYAPPQHPSQQPYAAAQPGSYAAYGTPAYPVARPTSGLAITSLVCAIASVVFSWLVFPILAAVAAVITGHMALKQTRSNPAVGGRGVAFAGLIIGYIMLGFLALGIIITIISFAFFGAFTIPFLVNS